MDYFGIYRHPYFRIVTAVLASISLATANPIVFLSGNPPVVAGGVLFTETFDASTEPSPPSGWTEIGTVNWDATGIMEGAQHIFLSAGAEAGGYKAFTASGTVEAFFWFYTPDATPTVRQRIAMLSDSGTAHGMEVYLETGGTVTIQDIADSSLSTAGGATLSNNTVTYFWLRYVKGTGANTAFYSVGFSTTGTRATAGTGYTETTNGESTVDVDTFRIARTSPTLTIRYDRAIVSTATIGDNP